MAIVRRPSKTINPFDDERIRREKAAEFRANRITELGINAPHVSRIPAPEIKPPVVDITIVEIPAPEEEDNA